MKQIRTILTALLVLSLVGAGAYAMYNRSLANKDLAQASEDQPSLFEKIVPQAIREKIAGVSDVAEESKNKLGDASQNPQLKSLSESASTQLQTLGDKTSVVTDQVGKVIQVNQEDETKSTSEKTLEYGQYLYCKQVVETYEDNLP